MNTIDISILFPAYAGGKFINNCLGLSKSIMLNQSKTQKNLKHLLTYPNDYDFRLDYILKTLPIRSSLNQWLYYELFEHNKNSLLYKIAKEKKFKFCFTHHSSHEIDGNNKIINLKNYQNFRKIAYNLKKTTRVIESEWEEKRYNNIKGSNWPTYEKFSSVGFDYNSLDDDESVKKEIVKYYPIGSYKKVFHFDMSKIFNYSMFIDEMKKVYVFLGLVDFPEDCIKVYYKKYIDLHSIEFIE